MASNGTNPTAQPLIPSIKGEKYLLWSLKIKTLFRSEEIWDLVENGYEKPDPAPAEPDHRLRENHKKDAKALLYIQSTLEDDIFL